jgi:hypothetical protein
MTYAALLLAAALTTPVLIPTFYNGPGQFGSQWRTEVFVANGMEESVEGRGVRFLVQCPIPEGCTADRVPVKQRAMVEGPESDRGLLLHLPADAAHRVEFSAHFGEGDRRSYVLPIVRERDFRDDRVALPLVPFRGDFRTTLRIYSPDPLVDQQVMVRVMPSSNPFAEALATRIVTLGVDVPTSLPMRPAFAQLVLHREFPEVTQSNVLRIELEPVPRLDGRIPRIWAFATVTFNDRNDVVVIVPQ